MSGETHLYLSLNELRALMRRTYEALYHHGYDFAVMARSCLWLEAHGLDGIGLIIRSLPDLETPAREIKLSEPTPNHFLLEGYGRCLIPFINASTDLAIAGAQESGFGQIDILNVFGRLNVFAALKKTARLNLYSAAIWYDATEARTHILWLQSSQNLPDYFVLNEVHQGPWGKSGLRFLCSTEAEVVKENVRRVLPENTSPHKTAMQLEKAYAQALENGISVAKNTYSQLNKIADRLLVPSTDASRRGAGE